MEVGPGSLWMVPESPASRALVRCRDAAEELTRRRAGYLTVDMPAPLDLLVACASAWSAVVVAECAAAATLPAWTVERIAVPPVAVSDHVERAQWLRSLLDGLGEGVHSWRFEEPADGVQVLEIVRRHAG